MLLLLPDVPVEALGQGGEPVRDLILSADGRNRVDGGRHAEAGVGGGKTGGKKIEDLEGRCQREDVTG